MKLLFIVLLLAFATITIYDASAACTDPHCYAVTTTGNEQNIEYEGLHYNIEIPDLWVDRTACENHAVSAGWLIAELKRMDNQPEWVEAGVVKGNVENEGCVTTLSTYHAFNNVDKVQSSSYQYQIERDSEFEFRVYSQLGHTQSAPTQVQYHPDVISGRI